MTCCSRVITGNTGIAHCSLCCQTFASVGYFDDHRRGGSCGDPAGLVGKDGKPRLRLDDRGVWVSTAVRPKYWKSRETV